MVTTLLKHTAASRLEQLPLSNYHQRIFLIIATAWFFDCIDCAMLTFALTSIKTDFHLNTVQTGLLGSMSFVGMFFGAASAGMLADRFGRRTIFQVSMIIWGIASLLCASAPNIQMLMFYRILLGIGIAMELPVGQSLLCELIPAKQRGRYLAFVEGCWPIGFIAAGVLSYYILPWAGWRGLFLAQGIPFYFRFYHPQVRS